MFKRSDKHTLSLAHFRKFDKRCMIPFSRDYMKPPSRAGSEQATGVSA